MNKKIKSQDISFSVASLFFGIIVVLILYISMPEPAAPLVVNDVTCEEEMEKAVKKHGTYEEYLIAENLPTEIEVDGETYYANERLGRLDCTLVYGDFSDMPSDIQSFIRTEWLYVGYDENGNPQRNVYVPKTPSFLNEVTN